jgi:hypothetical protein
LSFFGGLARGIGVIAQEALEHYGSYRAAAREVGLPLSTFYDTVQRPDAPRSRETRFALEFWYEDVRPLPNPLSVRTTRMETDAWLPSQIADMAPPPNARAFNVTYAIEYERGGPRYFVTRANVSLKDWSVADYLANQGIDPRDLANVVFKGGT